jgi:glycerate kinase
MLRRIVIAPDSFKGTLSARDAALALAEGWRAERPNDDLLLVPQADGGEGTLDAIGQAVPEAEWRTAQVSGPLAEPSSHDRRTQNLHDARWLLLPDGHAVIELAECCGLTLLPRTADGSLAFAPLAASSRGVGEAITVALAAGAQRITLALGGSASTDGGLGALSALGLRTLDASGLELELGGGALKDLASIDARSLHAAPPQGITLLVDTTAVLGGPHGAAKMFGPQKGATPGHMTQLDDGLARAATIAGGDAHFEPGSGAAGGTAWGFARYWGASIRSGADAIAELTGLDAALTGADLLITGEGCLDATSYSGKVVGAAVSRATAAGVALAIVAGQSHLMRDASRETDAEAAGLGTVLVLSHLAGSAAAAVQAPERWLRAAGAELARQMLDRR